MTGVMVAYGPCYNCKEVFPFDPDWVPSLFIDPETGLPPDLGGDPHRARREPICLPCRREINPLRIAQGQDPFPIGPPYDLPQVHSSGLIVPGGTE